MLHAFAIIAPAFAVAKRLNVADVVSAAFGQRHNVVRNEMQTKSVTLDGLLSNDALPLVVFLNSLSFSLKKEADVRAPALRHSD